MNNLLVYDRHFFPAMDPDSMAETVIILRSLMSTFENHLPLAARPWILVDPERYGYRRDAEVSHPFDGQLAQVPSPAGRGLESFLHDLNCFLLDGAITDGTQCRFQKKFHPMAWYQVSLTPRMTDVN